MKDIIDILNPEPDGTCRTIKANYHKVSLANFTRRGGMEQPQSSCIVMGRVWKSNQNGIVYDPNGLAPCLTVGAHSGVEPKIVVYETNKEIPQATEG